MEDGQDVATFRADLLAALKAAEMLNLNMESLVFPRNQTNQEYLRTCASLGIKTYRGNSAGWMYEPRQRERESLLRRACRLLDAYVKVSRDNTYDAAEFATTVPMNVPSSHYLRMYSRPLSLLEPLKINRISREMAQAAKRGRMYHLWFHPEDVGENIDSNLALLRKLFDEFARLRDGEQMQSLNMREVFYRFNRGQNANESLSSANCTIG
jgi:hypothetical protein